MPPELRAAYLLLKNAGYLEESLTSVKPISDEDQQLPLPETSSPTSNSNTSDKALRYNIAMESRRRR